MPITEVKQSDEISQRAFNTIRQTIKDIMTPERIRRMRKDIVSTAQAWINGKQKWAATLQAELVWLDSDTYEETPFYLAAFFGQLQRQWKTQKAGSKSKK